MTHMFQNQLLPSELLVSPLLLDSETDLLENDDELEGKESVKDE